MTLTLPTNRPQEARRAMTRPSAPRARTVHPTQARAHSILAAYQAARITPQAARTELLDLIMAARTGPERLSRSPRSCRRLSSAIICPPGSTPKL